MTDASLSRVHTRYRPDVRLITRSGYPGTGKTTRLVRESKDWEGNWAVLTYGKDSAAALLAKGLAPDRCGTVYGNIGTWPHVTHATGLRASGGRTPPTFQRRAIRDSDDLALDEYVNLAPSKVKKDPELQALGGWTPEEGEPPAWVWEPPSTESRKYAVGLVRWLWKGAPLVSDPLDFVAYDEAQDASRLEMAAALALLKPGGTLLACGDEGQAIFGAFKGYQPGELPAAWDWADEREYQSPGYRVGAPATEAASEVLRPYVWHDPALYTAQHSTLIHHWDMFRPPDNGMVLSLSRHLGKKYVRENNLKNVKLVPGVTGNLSVSTIHSAKGHEADSVYLLPWSRGMLKKLDEGDPELLKVAYVALTRARYHVHLPTELYLRWRR